MSTVFSFPPNWEQSVNETLEWHTDIIESKNGVEQTISTRVNPRKELEYRLTIYHWQKQLLQTLLWGWQSQEFLVPIWIDPGFLTAPAVTTDAVLNIDTTDLDFTDGGKAVLFTDFRTYEEIDILTVTPSTVVLSAGITGNWNTGTILYPARLGRMEAIQQIQNLNSNISELVVNFTFDENNVNFSHSELNSSTYRGFPILEELSYWTNSINESYERKLQVLDNITGIIQTDDLSARPVYSRDFSWFMLDRERITQYRRWLYARKGRRNPIWVDTEKCDITLASPIGSADLAITINNISYATFNLQNEIGRRDISIILKSGPRFYRRIENSATINPSTESLTLDSSLGQNVSITEIQRISYLQLSRLGSDSIGLAWHNCGLVESQHRFRGVSFDTKTTEIGLNTFQAAVDFQDITIS